MSVSPTTPCVPFPTSTSPVTTRPVFTPLCIVKGRPILCSNLGLMAFTKSCTSLAALIALTGSSSWTFGTPNSAITASPTNFSMKPSYLATTWAISPKTRLMISLTSSGSSLSDIAVNPERSEKSTVTCLRSPSTSAVGFSVSSLALSIFCPHSPQNLSLGSMSTPH